MIVRVAGQDVTLVKRLPNMWMADHGEIRVEVAPGACDFAAWVSFIKGGECPYGWAEGASAQTAIDNACAELRRKLRHEATHARRKYRGLRLHAMEVTKRMEETRDTAARVEALLRGGG